jgi:hypothetical protein
VIEVVDLSEVLTVIPATLDLVGIDIEFEAIGILGRDQVHLPERKEE